MSGPSISTDSLSAPHVTLDDNISPTYTSRTPSSNSSGRRRHVDGDGALTATTTLSSNELALDRVRDSRRNSKVPERFRKERERLHSERTTKQLIRLLVHEEYEARESHRLLRVAFERLESEAQRVNETEGRVLEIAQRFNAVNDARLHAQAEVSKLTAELGMYKLQLDNAQEEIFKAQKVLRKVEDERDDAAAEATEARDAARKYREQHIVHVAREEGRKMGYLQGIRHAQMGYVGTKTIEFPERGYTTEAISNRKLLMDEPFDDTIQDVFGDEEESVTDDDISTVPRRPLYMSRRTAHGVGVTSNPPRQSQAASHHVNLGSDRPTAWAGRSPTNDSFPRPVHNGYPAPHPDSQIPPDGWIPRSEDGSHIAIPPPHEFERASRGASGSSGRSWVTVSGIQNRLNRVFSTRRGRQQQSDTPDVAAPIPGYPPPSPPSTTFSQFDITATEPDMSEEARRKLSVIQEGSIEATPVSMSRSRTDLRTPGLETDYGYSPTTNFTIRSPQGEEEPVALMDVIRSHPHKSGPGGGDNHSLHDMQRLEDDPGYSDPENVENWRRSTVNATPIQDTYSPRRRPQNLTTPAPLSPSQGPAQSSLPRNSSTSTNIGIGVDPPTDSDAYGSQPGQTPAPGLLSPFTIPPSLQPAPYRQQSPRMTPIRAGSPAVNYDRSGLYSESPIQPSILDRDPRDGRRTGRESVGGPGSPYRAPGSVPSPRLGHSPQTSVPSISVSQLPRQAQAHSRSISMNAGSTPLRSGKPLSPLSTTLSLGEGLTVPSPLRRQPSASSLSSNRSSYKAYDPSEALDPAYLASATASADYRSSQTYGKPRSRSGRS